MYLFSGCDPDCWRVRREDPEVEDPRPRQGGLHDQPRLPEVRRQQYGKSLSC